MTSGESTTAVQRDPVCGMQVEPAKARGRHVHAGKEYLFCCPGCAEKFKASPETYLAPRPQPSGMSLTVLGNAPVQPHPPAPASSAVPSPLPAPAGGAEAEIEYTCPMDPQIVQRGPGICPICGMALEPRVVSGAVAPRNVELISMTRRLWGSAVLTVPLLLLGMAGWFGLGSLLRGMPSQVRAWLELALATPVVLWGGAPFFERGWQSLLRWRWNMFTLIAIGTGVAYGYSVLAVLFPRIFPAAFREMDGRVPVYFEAAAAITTLVLLGQVLELRARSRTSAAIRDLLKLSPKTARRLPGRRRERRRPSRPSPLATACASVRASACPWTACCSKAPALWTSPWSQASRCPCEKHPATASPAAH